MQRVLDPDGSARDRERRGRRKVEARKRTMQEVHIKRGKGLPVKNRADKRRRVQ